MTELLTVGHGTASAADLGARLQAASVRSLVDIRIAPGSRRNPHLGRDALPSWLSTYDVSYRWERRLGGFRRLPADAVDADVALRNTSFRAYAAHMRSPEFIAAADELLAEATATTIVMMCSESVWWRCHRRLVADFASLARGARVSHLLPDGRRAPHRLTDGVRLRDDGLLSYDVEPAAG